MIDLQSTFLPSAVLTILFYQWRVGTSAITALFVLATFSTAQEPPSHLRGVDLDSVARRVQSLSPESGTHGTEVILASGGLPAITPLRIGMGAMHFGFEEIGQVMTDRRGVFEITVAVPGWVTRDVTYHFIVFDFYFRPIALTGPFHVTDADGLLVRRGAIVNVGTACAELRGDDEVLYTLAGGADDYRVGDRIEVEGAIAESSLCTQGTTIEVVDVRERGSVR